MNKEELQHKILNTSNNFFGVRGDMGWYLEEVISEYVIFNPYYGKKEVLLCHYVFMTKGNSLNFRLHLLYLKSKYNLTQAYVHKTYKKNLVSDFFKPRISMLRSSKENLHKLYVGNYSLYKTGIPLIITTIKVNHKVCDINGKIKYENIIVHISNKFKEVVGVTLFNKFHKEILLPLSEAGATLMIESPEKILRSACVPIPIKESENFVSNQVVSDHCSKLFNTLTEEEWEKI